MLNILYFAQIGEQLNIEQETLTLTENIRTGNDLIQHLSQRGQNWQRVLTEQRLMMAVNQTMVKPDVILKAGDEVALFPPVTGG